MKRINNKLRTRSNRQKQSQDIVNLVRKTMTRLAEPKVNSIQAITNTVTTTGAVFNISNDIAEGSDISDRTGTKITMLELRTYYRCFAVTNSQTFRFILFRDMFNQGTTVGTGELLPANAWYSQYSDIHQIQQKRFHIIQDWTVDSNLNGNTICSLEKTFKVTGSIYYNGTTSVSASNGKGALFLLVIGSSNTGTYDWSIDLTFNDS